LQTLHSNIERLSNNSEVPSSDVIGKPSDISPERKNNMFNNE